MKKFVKDQNNTTYKVREPYIHAFNPLIYLNIILQYCIHPHIYQPNMRSVPFPKFNLHPISMDKTVGCYRV